MKRNRNARLEGRGYLHQWWRARMLDSMKASACVCVCVCARARATRVLLGVFKSPSLWTGRALRRVFLGRIFPARIPPLCTCGSCSSCCPLDERRRFCTLWLWCGLWFCCATSRRFHVRYRGATHKEPEKHIGHGQQNRSGPPLNKLHATLFQIDGGGACDRHPHRWDQTSTTQLHARCTRFAYKLRRSTMFTFGTCPAVLVGRAHIGTLCVRNWRGWHVHTVGLCRGAGVIRNVAESTPRNNNNSAQKKRPHLVSKCGQQRNSVSRTISEQTVKPMVACTHAKQQKWFGGWTWI